MSGIKTKAFRLLNGLFTSIIVFTFISLAACSSDRIFEENIDLENKIWLANDTVNFTFEVDDQTEAYNIFYNVRNTITYPYQNLYINYTLQNDAGDTIGEDLVNMTLFDPKTGKPYGKGLGDIFSHQFEIISQYQFPDTGVYHLKLNQFMRQDTLPEVLSVGVSVKQAVEER